MKTKTHGMMKLTDNTLADLQRMVEHLAEKENGVTVVLLVAEDHGETVGVGTLAFGTAADINTLIVRGAARIQSRIRQAREEPDELNAVIKRPAPGSGTVH